jgi:anti-sigma regulatory factor (Ser/Thr protein kinase)
LALVSYRDYDWWWSTMTTSPSPDTEGHHDTEVAEAVFLLDEPFEEPDLVALRGSVAAHADRAGLAPSRVNDLVLIAYELATNAVRHGGGRGQLRLWLAGGAVHCEVNDRGPGLPEQHRGEPDRPGLGAPGGRGLWIALTFSDQLKLTNTADGATVTAIIRLP